MPVWIQLPGLHLKYLSPNSLGRILSPIGKPRTMDELTRRKGRLQFARVLIDMKIQDNPPDKVKFVNEFGTIMEQRIVYEWKPVKCRNCSGYGHKTDECRREEIKAAAEQARKDRLEVENQRGRMVQTTGNQQGSRTNFNRSNMGFINNIRKEGDHQIKDKGKQVMVVPEVQKEPPGKNGMMRSTGGLKIIEPSSKDPGDPKFT